MVFVRVAWAVPRDPNFFLSSWRRSDSVSMSSNSNANDLHPNFVTWNETILMSNRQINLHFNLFSRHCLLQGQNWRSAIFVLYEFLAAWAMWYFNTLLTYQKILFLCQDHLFFEWGYISSVQCRSINCLAIYWIQFKKKVLPVLIWLG